MCLLMWFLEMNYSPHRAHMHLCIVPRDETVTTRSTLILFLQHDDTSCVSSCGGWILSSVTQSTMVCNVLYMALVLVTPEAPSEYFIHQESSLPRKCLQRGQNHVDFFLLPSAYSFHQGPGIISFSFMASSTLPGSCWIKRASLLTIPSTSTHNFLLQAAFNNARIMFGNCKLRSDYTTVWLQQTV